MAEPRRFLVVAMGNRVEALRVAVGLTLSDASLQVVVWGEMPDDEDASQHFEALGFGDVPVAVLPAGDEASWDELARHIVDSEVVYCL
jgi:hypothetical protein